MEKNRNYHIITGHLLGLYWDNGKENRNYHVITGRILGLYWDNGEEHGSYYIIIGCNYWGFVGIMDKDMATVIMVLYRV